MLFIGLMSGTSMDAIDAALVEIDNETLNVIHYHQFPIPSDIQHAIRCVDSNLNIHELTRLDVVLGELFAKSVLALLQQSKVDSSAVTAIGSHGQTMLHLPESNSPRTLQIGDPSIITVRTGIQTVVDFRRNDIAAGGQGAPLAPAFHAWQFHSNEVTRVILNLGGMANITVLPAGNNKKILGFDTGPGNGLMDSWVQKHQNIDYDIDGKLATEGTCNEMLLDIFMQDSYFSLIPPKSTGKDEFNQQWLTKNLDALGVSISIADVQRTLLELSARSICNAIKQYSSDAREILLCGGGIHNPLLVQRIETLLPDMEIVSTEKYGIHPDAVEAVAFAWLAKCRLDNTPGNIPSVTGAEKSVVLGAIYQS
ncbi:MAG: anhydro-N-acetylmuramic acid kinase [Gammaproteobacteria bacterium]